MKRIVIRLFLISMFFIIIIGIKKNVNANSINSIEMNITVYNTGNASVTEVWHCVSTSGTEWFKSYYNLGKSKITNLSVYTKNKKYETLDSWNPNASKEEKLYKCGLNKVKNGIEICWGKDFSYDEKYTISYNISNFIAELKDCQMIYWTLIPPIQLDNKGNVKIKIHYYKNVSEEVNVWGYGYNGGTCIVKGQDIIMESKDNLSNNEYMTILAKFPSGTFSTQNKLNHKFEHYYKMAEKSPITQSKKSNNYVWFYLIITSVFIGIAICIFFIIKACKKGISDINSTSRYGFRYGELGKLNNEKEYFRDIPCEGDILRSYYIAYQYRLVSDMRIGDLIGAIVLMWLKDGKIKIEKKENTSLIFKDKINTNNSTLTELYNMIYKASKNGILENNEFEEWCVTNCDQIFKWFDNILKEQRDKLILKGLITTKKGFFSKEYYATPELKRMAVELKGLKDFLNDYSLIKEKDAMQVVLFEEYMIYASLFGIANQVTNQFKDLYPKVIINSKYISYDNIFDLEDYVTKGIRKSISSLTQARYGSDDNYIHFNYNSRSGGFSSGGGSFRSGGGGGSFGSGGGIGSR